MAFPEGQTAMKEISTPTYTVFDMCRMEILSEAATNLGRIDAVLDAGKHLYIIEFKFKKSADAALEQIDEKKYAQGYIYPAKLKGQTVHKLEINFVYGGTPRNIGGWKEVLIRSD